MIVRFERSRGVPARFLEQISPENPPEELSMLEEGILSL